MKYRTPVYICIGKETNFFPNRNGVDTIIPGHPTKVSELVYNRIEELKEELLPQDGWLTKVLASETHGSELVIKRTIYFGIVPYERLISSGLILFGEYFFTNRTLAKMFSTVYGESLVGHAFTGGELIWDWVKNRV